MSGRGFFAGRLKELREGAGLSQPALSERSGVAVSTIRQFEYGRREPTYGTLIKLAEGLGVSLSAFDQGRAATPTPAQGASGQAKQSGKPSGRKRAAGAKGKGKKGKGT